LLIDDQRQRARVVDRPTAGQSTDIWDVAPPIMNDLSKRLQESYFAAVLDQDSVIYVARATSNQRVSVGISISSRVPAHCVSSGRVVLAALPQDLLHKYLRAIKSRDSPERHHLEKSNCAASSTRCACKAGRSWIRSWKSGLRSLSALIRDGQGKIVAALNVCCPCMRITPEGLRTRVPAETLAASNARVADLIRKPAVSLRPSSILLG
jgi:IclR family transcriptional regulator, pca regulon regulatory protein